MDTLFQKMLGGVGRQENVGVTLFLKDKHEKNNVKLLAATSGGARDTVSL